MVRIQVIVDEAERERFRQLADREGLSLSGWLRKLALERATEDQSAARINSVADLEKFFRACDRRNKGRGRESDWKDHLAVMERSRSSGQSGT